MKRRNAVLSVLVAVVLVLSLGSSVSAQASPEYEVTEISKYGNATLSAAKEEFLARGFKYGDIVSFSVNGKAAVKAPLVSNYSDVDSGALAVLAREKDAFVTIAVNMGNFAEGYGAVVGDKVTIELAEAGGYYDDYLIHKLARTDVRSDYGDLSDAEYANFRNVVVGNIPKGVLYRSSSPVNNEIARAKYADTAAKNAKIAIAVNLADSAEVLSGYFAEEGFASDYYKSLYEAGKVIPLNMGVDFAADDFSAKLAEGVRFINANGGSILIHCNEGKDRAGFVCAVFEALSGADLEAIIDDYMLTFANYYHVKADTDQYTAIVNSNIVKTLGAAFGASDRAALEAMNLADAAKSYLAGIGLSEAEISALAVRLSTPVKAVESDNPPTGDSAVAFAASALLALSALVLRKRTAA